MKRVTLASHAPFAAPVWPARWVGVSVPRLHLSQPLVVRFGQRGDLGGRRSLATQEREPVVVEVLEHQRHR